MHNKKNFETVVKKIESQHQTALFLRSCLFLRAYFFKIVSKGWCHSPTKLCLGLFWSRLGKFDQGSSLIKSDQIWSSLMKFVWSSLIKFVNKFFQNFIEEFQSHSKIYFSPIKKSEMFQNYDKSHLMIILTHKNIWSANNWFTRCITEEMVMFFFHLDFHALPPKITPKSEEEEWKIGKICSDRPNLEFLVRPNRTPNRNQNRRTITEP